MLFTAEIQIINYLLVHTFCTNRKKPRDSISLVYKHGYQMVVQGTIHSNADRGFTRYAFPLLVITFGLERSPETSGLSGFLINPI